MWRLIEGLPNDSALHRAIDPDGVGAGWTREAHLLAVLAEVSDVTNAILIKVNSKDTGRKMEPLRIPRPGQPVQEDRQLEGVELDAAVRMLGGKVKHGKKTKAR